MCRGEPLPSRHRGRPSGYPGTVTDPTLTGAQHQGACCSDPDAARALQAERAARLRRATVISAALALAVVVVGIVLGGYVGAALLLLVAMSVLATLVRPSTPMPLTDRMLRLAIAVLLVGVAVVRAVPR